MEESSRAIQAFEYYYDLGTGRSLVKLHEWYQSTIESRLQNGEKIPALSTLRKWSDAFEWPKRCKERDAKEIAERLAKERKKKLEKLDKLNEAQAEVAQNLWVKTAKLLLKRIEEENIHPRDAVALLKEAWNVHRIAAGAATERIETELSNNPDAPLKLIADFGGASLEKEE